MNTIILLSLITLTIGSMAKKIDIFTINRPQNDNESIEISSEPLITTNSVTKVPPKLFFPSLYNIVTENPPNPLILHNVTDILTEKPSTPMDLNNSTISIVTETSFVDTTLTSVTLNDSTITTEMATPSETSNFSNDPSTTSSITIPMVEISTMSTEKPLIDTTLTSVNLNNSTITTEMAEPSETLNFSNDPSTTSSITIPMVEISTMLTEKPLIDTTLTPVNLNDSTITTEMAEPSEISNDSSTTSSTTITMVEVMTEKPLVDTTIIPVTQTDSTITTEKLEPSETSSTKKPLVTSPIFENNGTSTNNPLTSSTDTSMLTSVTIPMVQNNDTVSIATNHYLYPTCIKIIRDTGRGVWTAENTIPLTPQLNKFTNRWEIKIRFAQPVQAFIIFQVSTLAINNATVNSTLLENRVQGKMQKTRLDDRTHLITNDRPLPNGLFTNPASASLNFVFGALYEEPRINIVYVKFNNVLICHL